MHPGIFMAFAVAVINSAVADKGDKFSLEYFLSATNLHPSDPYVEVSASCILWLKKGGSWSQDQDRGTEVQRNTPNPVWQQKFRVNYIIGESKDLRVEVYDGDQTAVNQIGAAEVDVNSLVKSCNYQVSSPSTNYVTTTKLVGKYNQGTLKWHSRISSITDARRNRAAASSNHLTLLHNAFLAMSINYFLVRI